VDESPRGQAFNLGLKSELIHQQNGPEIFLPRLRDQDDRVVGIVVPIRSTNEPNVPRHAR
jgi:hypothetical protein